MALRAALAAERQRAGWWVRNRPVTGGAAVVFPGMSHTDDDYEQYVRQLVDAAPPLRPEQIAKLRTLFDVDTPEPPTA